MTNNWKQILLKVTFKYVVMFIAACIYAVAISLFLDPNKIAPGGVTGISIIINRYSGLSTGTLILIINIPLLIIGAWKFGIKFFVSTIFALGMGSIMVDILGTIGALSEDLLVSAVLGGLLFGLSLGIIFKMGATTGGTDIVARLLKIRYPHIETGILIMSVDIFIVVASAIVFRDIEIGAYAGISVFITGKVFDLILYGGQGARFAFIISKNEKEIAEQIMKELKRGVTYLYGKGAYTNAEKNVIMCALKKQQIPKLCDTVKNIDESAFLIITSANEIVGEGYRSPFEERI